MSTLSITIGFIRAVGIYLAMIVVGLFALGTALDSLPYLFSQFFRLLEGEGLGNLANFRLEQFYFALDTANQSVMFTLFGNGPAKSEMEHVESIYTYSFYRYGIAGVFLYFFVLFSVIVYCFKVLRARGSGWQSFALFFEVFLWLLIVPVVSIRNNFTEQVRASYSYYYFIGLVCAEYWRKPLGSYL